MDIRDDFFFNASLTILSGPRLHGFKANDISLYKSTLIGYLTRIQEGSEDFSDTQPRHTKGDIQLKWKHWGSLKDHVGLSTRVTYSLDMVFIQFNRTLHRFCIITRHHLESHVDILRHSVVVMANATSEVLDVCRYWMSKQFDTMLTPFEIDQKMLYNEYDLYLKSTIRQSGFGTDSELIFSVGDSLTKKLRHITIAVSGQDLPGYFANQ